MIPLLPYDNPTCASGCQVLWKSVLDRDALFMDWIRLEVFPCVLIRRASVDCRWRRIRLKLVIPWWTRSLFSFYAGSASDEKAVDTWSRLFLR